MVILVIHLYIQDILALDTAPMELLSQMEPLPAPQLLRNSAPLTISSQLTVWWPLDLQVACPDYGLLMVQTQEQYN